MDKSMENIISIFMVLFLIVAFSLITVFFAVQVCIYSALSYLFKYVVFYETAILMANKKILDIRKTKCKMLLLYFFCIVFWVLAGLEESSVMRWGNWEKDEKKAGRMAYLMEHLVEGHVGLSPHLMAKNFKA